MLKISANKGSSNENNGINYKNLITMFIASTQLLISSCATEVNEIPENLQNNQLSKTLNITQKASNIIQETKSETEIVLKINIEHPLLIKSKGIIGKEEFQSFIDFFGFSSDEEILAKIMKIQEENHLKIDGILGNQTLNAIYHKYYIKNVNKLSKEQQKRIEIHNSILGYGKKGKGNINIFNNDIYYGDNVGTNITGTLFNEELYNKGIYELERENKTNEIIINQIDGKFHLIVYVEGELSLLSYTSPGGFHFNKELGKTRKYPTPTGKYNILGLDKYHISSSYPKNKSGINGGAKMPFAINFCNYNFWIHGGLVDGTRLSHGCLRLPLFYNYELFEMVKKIGKDSFKITINSN